MSRAYLFALWLICSLSARTQYVYTIKADSVKLTNNCDSTELILMNHTQGIPGFLYNYGNGRTRFQRGLVNLGSNTYLIGADTLKAFGNVLLVPDIPGLQADTFTSANIIVVSDTLRGGLFVYQSTAALPDSGIVFPATGRGSGYWVRTGAANTAANVEWYGAIPNDNTKADINFHAMQSCMYHNRVVYIPTGLWYSDSTLHVISGQDIFGEKATVVGSTGSGTTLITVDTVTAMMYDGNSGVDDFTYIHDLTLSNTASGGTLNYGLVITQQFYHVERVVVSGFGNDGVLITGNFNGVGSVADQGYLNLVFSENNGGKGFYIGGGVDVNDATFIQCEASGNGGGGFYISGNHETLMNCSDIGNAHFGIDDEGSSDVYINPTISPTTDSVILNGCCGFYESSSAISVKWPNVINSLWHVQMGQISNLNQDLVSPNAFNRLDTTTTQVTGDLGHFSIGAYIGGTPNDGEIDLNGITGDISAQGNLYFLSSSAESEHIYLQNTGTSPLNITGDRNSMLVSHPYGSNPIVASLATSGNTPFGGGMAAIGTQAFNGTGDGSADLAIYSRSTNSSRSVNAGVVRFTAFDTTNLAPLSNDQGARDYVDASSGQWNFYTFGTNPSTLGIDQAYGGNIYFGNRDGSANLYLNTFNKSVYAGSLKLGASPSPSAGDSLLVWESSDSSVRKVAPATAVNNVVTITANYTAGTNYPGTIIICNASSATITLPDPTTASSQNKYYYIRVQTSGQTATVATAAGSIETSLGSFASTASVPGIPSQGWISNGTNWVLATN